MIMHCTTARLLILEDVSAADEVICSLCFIIPLLKLSHPVLYSVSITRLLATALEEYTPPRFRVHPSQQHKLAVGYK